MNLRRIIALAGCLLLATVVAVSTASARTSKKSAKTLTVWLMADAQTGWPDVVKAANTKFEAANPGVNVDLQYQTWGAYLNKFDATLAGGNVPDVLEFGNTQMQKYVFAGALEKITPSNYENSKYWLAGLADAAKYKGTYYGVPYYAGSRLVAYRTDLFKKAGVKVPKTLAAFQAGAVKLNKKFGKKGFSAVYIPGTDWYFAMGFLFDRGGGIAKLSGGKWHSLLNTKQSLLGLKTYKAFWKAASRTKPNSMEINPAPYDVYAQNRAAAIVGPGWFTCCVGKYKSVTKQFVMPSATPGKVMPGFLGGSNLAIPKASNMKTEAAAWLKIFIGTGSEKAIVAASGNIPNATNLADPKQLNQRAAARSWFVPMSPNWANVENGNVLRTMLKQILSGSLTIPQAARNAGDNIELTLNQK